MIESKKKVGPDVCPHDGFVGVQYQRFLHWFLFLSASGLLVLGFDAKLPYNFISACAIFLILFCLIIVYDVVKCAIYSDDSLSRFYSACVYD